MSFNERYSSLYSLLYNHYNIIITHLKSMIDVINEGMNDPDTDIDQINAMWMNELKYIDLVISRMYDARLDMASYMIRSFQFMLPWRCNKYLRLSSYARELTDKAYTMIDDIMTQVKDAAQSVENNSEPPKRIGFKYGNN